MITIRRAGQPDVPAIVQFSAALFQEDAGTRNPAANLEWAQEYGTAYFSAFLERKNHIILVAVAERETIGYLAGYVALPGEYLSVTSATLESIYLLPEFRKQGVGKQLAQNFIEWSEILGAVRLTVTAYTENRAAVAFYRRLGFVPLETTLVRKAT